MALSHISNTKEKAVLTTNVEDEIRLRAYELYQQRGNATGNEREDWLTAEHKVKARVLAAMALRASESTMSISNQRRTTMKAHEKRFIIEVGNGAIGSNRKWSRSGNAGLTGFFATREEAQTALAKGEKSEVYPYRVRQK
jgi:hypothetical protein